MQFTVSARAITWFLFLTNATSFAAHCEITEDNLCAPSNHGTRLVMAGWLDLDGQLVIENLQSDETSIAGIEFQSQGGHLFPMEKPVTAPFPFRLSNTETQITFGSLTGLNLETPWNSGVIYGLEASSDLCADLTIGASTVSRSFCTIPGDTNFDGKVGFADFLIYAENFGAVDATWPQGDFDGDRRVSFVDFLKLRANFGQSIPELDESTTQALQGVPEPSANLIAISLIMLVVCARRRLPT